MSDCCCPEATNDGAPASSSGGGGIPVLDRVGADVPIFDTAAETTLYTFTVPAGTVTELGQTLRLRLRGDMAQGVAGSPTFILRIRFNGTIWYQDTAVGRLNLPVAVPWRLDVELARKGPLLFYGSAVYDGGNANNGATTGGGDLGMTGSSSSPTLPLDSIGSDACDWSVAQTIAISIQFSAANPALGTTLRSGTLVLE